MTPSTLGACGDLDALRAVHAHYFLELAEEAGSQLQGAGQAARLSQLDAELGNLRAAVQWGLESKKPDGSELAARIAGSIWSFLWTRGYLTEGRGWLQAALSSTSLSPEVRAAALRAAGILAHDQGDYVEAEASFQEALALRRELGDTQGVALALNSLGVLMHRRSDYSRARNYYEESLVIFERLGDRPRIAVALNNLGSIAERQHDFGCADDYYEQSLALSRDLSDKEGIAWALDNLGFIASLQGNFARAWHLHSEGLAIFWELGDKQGIAVCLEHMAGVLGSGQDVEGARRAVLLFGAADVLREKSGSIIHPSNRITYDQRVANVREQLGNVTFEAEWSHGRGLPLESIVASALEEGPVLSIDSQCA
jgi:tetratricopeptide (TPR) repeat protein